MSDRYTTLLGTEDVARAGSAIQSAAADMQRAADTFTTAVERHIRAMDDFAIQMADMQQGPKPCFQSGCNQMTTIENLRELLRDAPDFPNELVDSGDGFYDCPLCDGQGTIDAEQVTHARANSWPGGAQFYGCGHEFEHAEKLYLAMRNALPDLLAVVEAAQLHESVRNRCAGWEEYEASRKVLAEALAKLTKPKDNA